MNIKMLKQFLAMVLTVSVMAACTKEEPLIIEKPAEKQEESLVAESTMQDLLKADLMVNEAASEYNKKMCFELNFPVELVYADKTTNEIDSFNALETAFDTWYEENKNKGKKGAPMLNFPVEITLADGSVELLTDESALRSLMKECFENKNVVERKCFEINYPVSVKLEGQNEATTVNSQEALGTLLKNREEATKFEFVFPIQVTLAEGEVKAVATNDDFNALKKDCRKKDNEDKDKEDKDKDELDWEAVYSNIDKEFLRNRCFQIEFPIGFELKDGSVVSVNSYDEIFETLAEQLRDNNGELPELKLSYPLTVTLYEDKTSVTVNNEDELENLSEKCELDWQGHNDDKDWDDHDKDYEEIFEFLKNECFKIEFPVNIELQDGSIVAVNNNNEIYTTLAEELRNNDAEFPELTIAYPLTVTLWADRTSTTLNSEDELTTLYEECKLNWQGHDDDDKDNEDWGDVDVELGDFDWEDFDLDQINFENFDFSNLDFSDLNDFKVLCFQINFPVEINITAEERISAENFGDLLQQMFAIILTNRGQDIEPKVNYPITVTLEDKTVKTINSDEELEELMKKCNG